LEKSSKRIDTVNRINAEEFKEVKVGKKAKLLTFVKTVNIAQNMLKMPLASRYHKMTGSKISILKNRFLALCRWIA
jgi:hypothetical protein